MNNKDFIEKFPNALSAEDCQIIIDYFDQMREHNLIFSRQQLNDGDEHQKKDETIFLLSPETITFHQTHPVLRNLVKCVSSCYQLYMKKYSVLSESRLHGISSIRLQKTEIGGGYHSWHYENNGIAESSRFLAFTVYLNDVENGGETEYLYQSLRIPAEQGTVIIWPAAFTHPHRGNPPLSGKKYIATGWIQFFE
jgi:hypothetical protein